MKQTILCSQSNGGRWSDLMWRDTFEETVLHTLRALQHNDDFFCRWTVTIWIQSCNSIFVQLPRISGFTHIWFLYIAIGVVEKQYESLVCNK